MGIKILPEKIPESDINVLARSLLCILSDFYVDAENQNDFEEWLRANGGQSNG